MMGNITKEDYLKEYIYFLEEQLEEHDLDYESARLHFDGTNEYPWTLDKLL